VRRAAIVLAVGGFATAAQGALDPLLPGFLVPDYSLLACVAAALLLGPVEGLLVAAALGLFGDALSGSLLGQQALMRTFEFALTRAVSAQLDLMRSLPLAWFVLALATLDAFGMALLTRVYLGPFALVEGPLTAVGWRVLACALIAPIFTRVTRSLAERLDETEARREMRLDTRRPSL
jgi:rod shape-determining protein MreD